MAESKSFQRQWPELWKDQCRRQDKARRRALAELRELHREEYDQLHLKHALPLGITPKWVTMQAGPIRKRRG